MKNIEAYYTDLISKYLNGEASPSEIRELENWVKSDSENREIFQSFHKAWQLTENSRLANSINLDEAWAKLYNQIPKTSAGIPRRISFNLILSPVIPYLRIAAVILILLIPAFLFYRSFSVPDNVEILAAHGITDCTLPDGSIVTLNNGARITYPEKFKGADRIVQVTGQAFFEVTHDAKHPFIVEAGKARVRVLGTSFEVNTDAAGNLNEVILATGKVKVYDENLHDRQVMLLPGEKATLSIHDPVIRKSVNTNLNYLSWKTKRLVFNNTSLVEVAGVISQVYHVDIRISGSATAEFKITATFEKQSLESVLNVLKSTLDLQIRKTGRGIEISDGGAH